MGVAVEGERHGIALQRLFEAADPRNGKISSGSPSTSREWVHSATWRRGGRRAGGRARTRAQRLVERLLHEALDGRLAHGPASAAEAAREALDANEADVVDDLAVTVEHLMPAAQRISVTFSGWPDSKS